MIRTYEELTLSHPCFAQGKKNNKGRIHLPVSPGCNIQCRFCERSHTDTDRENQRPGVTGEIITPEEAVDVVRRSLELCPDITVAGIAGPGDTLATPYALQTFRLIGKEFPDIIKCMSTNGLLLPEKADEIIDVGVDTLTVTVNAVDPEIQAKINKGIYYHGKYYSGVEAAEILIHNQLEGIRKVTKGGVTVKVNSVLITEINMEHIEDIAKAVSEAGASIYNLIPLIPQHELKDCARPSCIQIDGTRARAEKHINVFRHCQHCRDDAIGVPGEKDYGDQIYLKRISHKDTFSHG